ncbi:MAG TPA: methylenetetrahydrofolate reductase, partial [Giesbergeria sp.]|nr:methylenetetrahydrofolate reductase [Giesbergeria sp.]
MTATNAARPGLPVSVEFFPPKTPEGADKLRAVRQQLYALQPQFCSVTYGAGGSTQQGTFDTVQAILQEGVDAASHFSCIGATRASVREQLATLKAMGVRRLVALRGDLPSGYGMGGEFHYASDLVAFIRAETGRDFHIEVAAYPEIHPQARSPEADLKAYAAKVQAGADAAITQYFYSGDAYLRFVDEARRLGADVPVVPGIMPITSSTQLMRFSDACGAEIP